jgi:hypothetical protein
VCTVTLQTRGPCLHPSPRTANLWLATGVEADILLQVQDGSELFCGDAKASARAVLPAANTSRPVFGNVYVCTLLPRDDPLYDPFKDISTFTHEIIHALVSPSPLQKPHARSCSDSWRKLPCTSTRVCCGST